MKPVLLRLGIAVRATICVWFLLASSAFADDAAAPVPATLLGKEIVVGTKQAAPFAMKGEDGKWTGLSIELWQQIADQLHLRYRFEEVPTVQDLVDGVAGGRFDAAIAAITVTADRQKKVDFSQPFFETGLGIAVPSSREANWRPILRSMTSFGFLQAILVLIVLALVVGVLVWLFERRHNEDFGGGTARGLSSSFWWSATAMTQASTGDFGPRTLPGRFVAILWMVGSIIAIAIFTAGVTSVLTTKQLEGLVRGENDLPSVRVGDVAHSSTEAYLDGERIRRRAFPSPQEGLQALQNGNVDAFVYDRPLLEWIISQNFSGSLEVLDATFDHQQYAIALPDGSPLRKPINVATLKILEGDDWKQTQFRYFGNN